MSQSGNSAKRNTPATPTSHLVRTIQEKSMPRSFAYAVAMLVLAAVGFLTETLGAYRSAEIAH